MGCWNIVAVSGRTTDVGGWRRVDWKRARRDGGGRAARIEGFILQGSRSAEAKTAIGGRLCVKLDLAHEVMR